MEITALKHKIESDNSNQNVEISANAGGILANAAGVLANAVDITALQGQLGTSDGGALGLTDRVGLTEEAITALQGQLGTSDGGALGLTDRVGGNETAIEGHATAIAGNMSEIVTMNSKIETNDLNVSVNLLSIQLANDYLINVTNLRDDRVAYNMNEIGDARGHLNSKGGPVTAYVSWDIPQVRLFDRPVNLHSYNSRLEIPESVWISPITSKLFHQYTMLFSDNWEYLQNDYTAFGQQMTFEVSPDFWRPKVLADSLTGNMDSIFPRCVKVNVPASTTGPGAFYLCNGSGDLTYVNASIMYTEGVDNIWALSAAFKTDAAGGFNNRNIRLSIDQEYADVGGKHIKPITTNWERRYFRMNRGVESGNYLDAFWCGKKHTDTVSTGALYIDDWKLERFNGLLDGKMKNSNAAWKSRSVSGAGAITENVTQFENGEIDQSLKPNIDRVSERDMRYSVNGEPNEPFALDPALKMSAWGTLGYEDSPQLLTSVNISNPVNKGRKLIGVQFEDIYATSELGLTSFGTDYYYGPCQNEIAVIVVPPSITGADAENDMTLYQKMLREDWTFVSPIAQIGHTSSWADDSRHWGYAIQQYYGADMADMIVAPSTQNLREPAGQWEQDANDAWFYATEGEPGDVLRTQAYNETIYLDDAIEITDDSQLHLQSWRDVGHYYNYYQNIHKSSYTGKIILHFEDGPSYPIHLSEVGQQNAVITSVGDETTTISQTFTLPGPAEYKLLSQVKETGDFSNGASTSLGSVIKTAIYGALDVEESAKNIPVVDNELYNVAETRAAYELGKIAWSGYEKKYHTFSVPDGVHEVEVYGNVKAGGVDKPLVTAAWGDFELKRNNTAVLPSGLKLKFVGFPGKLWKPEDEIGIDGTPLSGNALPAGTSEPTKIWFNDWAGNAEEIAVADGATSPDWEVTLGNITFGKYDLGWDLECGWKSDSGTGSPAYGVGQWMERLLPSDSTDVTVYKNESYHRYMNKAYDTGAVNFTRHFPLEAVMYYITNNVTLVINFEDPRNLSEFHQLEDREPWWAPTPGAAKVEKYRKMPTITKAFEEARRNFANLKEKTTVKQRDAFLEARKKLESKEDLLRHELISGNVRRQIKRHTGKK